MGDSELKLRAIFIPCQSSSFTPTASESAPESNVEATIRRKFRVSLLKLDESNLVTGIGNIPCQEKLELAALSDRRKG